MIKGNDKPRCICCNSKGLPLYTQLKDKLFKAPGVWQLEKCSQSDCGLIWLNPAPAAEDLHIAYRHYYTHAVPQKTQLSFFQRIVRGYQAKHFKYLTQTSSPLYQMLGSVLSVIGFVREHMNFPFIYFSGVEKGRLLELGVGSGANLKKFIHWGWQANGLDFDPKAVDACRESGLNVMVGDLISQQFDQASYDAIFSSHVLEHLTDPVAVFKESYRVLRQPGIFVAVTPNANSFLHSCFGRAWRGLEPPRHLHVFTANALLKLALDAGFTKVSVSSSNLSSSEIFMLSCMLKYKISSSIYLKLVANIVRALLNIYRVFKPMTGEELVLIAQK